MLHTFIISTLLFQRFQFVRLPNQTVYQNSSLTHANIPKIDFLNKHSQVVAQISDFFNILSNLQILVGIQLKETQS